MLRAYGATDKGRIRSTNEDHFAIDERLRLLVVADGMGGHNAGEVASHVAVDAIVEFVADARDSTFDTWPFGFDRTLSDIGNVLRTAVHHANIRVLEVAGTTEDYAGMGTTVVAALVGNDRVAVAHVGDSRLYLASDGRLRQLTRDDSWVATMLADNPEADPAILQHHPMRNALTNVVGARQATQVHLAEEPLSAGDVLLLTTDGVHGVLDARSLERMLERVDVEQMPAEIIAAALARGSRDNCTAIVAQYAKTP